MNVLLLGANDRAAFSFAKSFFKKGYRVTVLNDTTHAIRYSRFVDTFIDINCSFEKKTDTAAALIIKHLQQNKHDILIPVHDTALTICNKYKDELSALIKLIYVNENNTHIFCKNKSALLQRCVELNIPAPKSVIINKVEELDRLEGLSFPCIIKPVSSKVYRNGKIFSYTVKKVKTKEELIDFVREKIETVSVMIQEILEEGFGVGYNFLSLNGAVLNAYAHQRVNEAWGGGQSTYRKTIPGTSYNLEVYSKELIESIGWTGIAMIEYRIVNNVPYIMEINGRGWGSIELGIVAGCRLPEDMINVLYLNEPIQQYTFKQSYYARNLFNEIIWVMQSRSPSVFIKWIWSLRKTFLKDHIIEDNIFTDFNFRVHYIKDVIGEQLKKVTNKIRLKIFKPSIKIVDKSIFNASKNVAFICKGNINRSPFAELYVKKINKNINVTSYGTVFEEDRLSPVNALKAAEKFGINMGVHRSKCLSEEAISKTDIFIIMDEINFIDLRTLNVPESKIFLLSKSAIADPYSHDLAFFEKIFRQITDSINLIFE
jgi:predicted ATP-grasp superfamily ATP-dependent carboligase/protein-tyrosine-phosphatase